MRVVEGAAEMQRVCWELRAGAAGSPAALGLVPTMGALHEGHMSLVRRARAECGAVVASIFVNPLQFGAGEDLERYPRTFAEDCARLEGEGVAAVFAPGVAEMYPAGAVTTITVGGISDRLDGGSRPGHFTGVATVVAKLLHVAGPDRAYFGQKDAAQLAVIRRMVRDLNFAVEIVGCPIVRDADGLALSSRNAYLSAEERSRALVLPRALTRMQDLVAGGEREAAVLLAAGREMLTGVRVDYLAAVDAETLLPVERVEPGTLMAGAVVVGTTRLIDNFLSR